MQESQGSERCWYAMRFLYNSQPSVRRQLDEAGFETFCPMKTTVRVDARGRRMRVRQPVLSDLYFVRSRREELDPYVDANPYFQYRYRRGGAYREPIVVPEREMKLFIEAVRDAENVLYFRPEELDAAKGTRIRLIGGRLDGYECVLLKVKGARAKRLLVEIPDTVIAAVEADPDLVQVIENV